jgi:hypothetical protein
MRASTSAGWASDTARKAASASAVLPAGEKPQKPCSFTSGLPILDLNMWPHMNEEVRNID